MRNLTFGLVVALLSSHSWAALRCEAWYQAPGAQLEKIEMPIVMQTENNTIYEVKHKDHTYRVDWNKNLTTLYTTIHRGEVKILFTTGREPTENHPECFTDLVLQGGLRRSVNCEEK